MIMSCQIIIRSNSLGYLKYRGIVEGIGQIKYKISRNNEE